MNVIKNNVTLEGSNELLKEVIRFLTRKRNEELDYNAIMPMPEELKKAEALEYSTDDLLWGRYLTDGCIRPEAVRKATEWLTAKTGKRPEGNMAQILDMCKKPWNRIRKEKSIAKCVKHGGITSRNMAAETGCLGPKKTGEPDGTAKEAQN